MTLSICTICQDEEEPIRWFLECCKHSFSILKESLKEIVIVDGGSKDNTLAVIKEYQDELPIKLLERTWDYPANQMNFGLEYCTGDYVFTPDADMTWTTNFSEVFQSGYFGSHDFWDFYLLFTGKDAYHYFYKWPLGCNIRMHKRGPKWTRKYHVLLEGQKAGIPICKDVIIFENSCRIKNEKALMNRGERRQIFESEMAEEGASPGPVDRFFTAAQSLGEVQHISKFEGADIVNLILPSTDG